MKFSLTFKTPNVLRQVINDIISEEEMGNDPYLFYEAEEGIKEKLSKWLKYGELITIDFDLNANTATVQETK